MGKPWENGKTMGKPWENGDLYSNYGWLVVWNMNFIFLYIGNVIIPNDCHIFQRGLNHQPDHIEICMCIYIYICILTDVFLDISIIPIISYPSHPSWIIYIYVYIYICIYIYIYNIISYIL